jgi:ABC-type sugar transport system substrate-binding protein
MKKITKLNQKSLIIIFALIFVAVTIGSSGAEVMKINPKGNKKIKIGVIDPNAAIELAALCNKEHKAAADARGWALEFFDLKDNFPEAVTIMENMISAGYDGIIIHWQALKTIDKQIKKAYELGIPIITLAAQGSRFPGVVADCGPLEGTEAAIGAEYLASKLQAGDKVLTISIPVIESHTTRLISAKGVFEAYKIKIAQELYFPLTGDPMQWTYDQTKNALLGDTKKEIKGAWGAWEGFSNSAARAAHEIGRDDFMAVGIDDSPNTYTMIRTLPTLIGTVGFCSLLKDINGQIFGIFDKIFKGQSVETQKYYGYVSRLVNKENLPPKGYFINPCGYKGRPDFEVK